MKIVDVHPIIRDSFMFGNTPENIADNGCSAGSGHSGDKYIVSGMIHFQGKFDGFNCPLLAYDFIQWLNLFGRFKGKIFWIDSFSKL